MRLLNFFKLLNKKTNGHFGIIIAIIVLIALSITITVFGYGLLENNPDKPYAIFLFLSTLIHSVVVMLVLGAWILFQHRVMPFWKEIIIPLWEEADNNPTQKSGGKVKF